MTVKKKTRRAAKCDGELTSITQLKGAAYNPRSITEEALEGLQHSLAGFGDISGIVWNKRTGNLVAGHQRLRALREKYGKDLKLVDGVLVADHQRFTVRVVDWDEATEKAANVTANNPNIAGEFTDGLQAVLEEIEANQPDLMPYLNLDELLDRAMQGDQKRAGNHPLTDPPEEDVRLDESFQVVVECDSEAKQRSTFEKLKREGYKCRVLTL